MRISALVLCLAGPAAADLPPEQLNVVLLFADDLGWTDLGCQGSGFYETPAIDRLAAQGLRFTQAYAAGCVCSPTRAALFTGKTPARLRATDYFGGARKGQLLPAEYVRALPAEETTLAEALRAAGRRTGFFGKWHLGGEGSYPEDHGFETNVGGFERGHPPKGYFSPYGNPKLSDGPPGELLTERLTAEACAWLDAVADDPFLLVLSYYTVHTPLQTKAVLREHFAAKAAARPAAEGEAWGTERERKVRIVQDHAVYAGMVASLDASVGAVLAKLEELGVAERTLVVFTSDNGGLSTSEGHPTSNVPLRAGKGWLYEGGIRVPLLVRLPGVTAAGATCGVPVVTTDLYPTVLAAAGLDARAEQRDGVDLTPLFAGSESLGERDLFWHYPHYGNQGGAPSGAIRAGRWKLVEWFEDGAVELYDLEADPSESRDLSGEEAGRAAALRTRLTAWRETVDAAMPRPNPEAGKR